MRFLPGGNIDRIEFYALEAETYRLAKAANAPETTILPEFPDMELALNDIFA